LPCKLLRQLVMAGVFFMLKSIFGTNEQKPLFLLFL